MTTGRQVGLLVLLALLAGCAGTDGTARSASPSSDGRASSPAMMAGDSSARPSPPARAPASAGVRAGQVDASDQAPSDDVPSRIVVAGLGIDLPVVSGDIVVAGNRPDYPLCDVAQYLTTYRYPGRPGTTTWIYAHARAGMFLPLLDASTRVDGAELIGQEVLVSTTAGLVYRYRITQVLPHATDRAIAADVPADEHRLVLQTSEGPRGTIPKLQVAATLLDVASTSEEDARPTPSPRVCG